MKNIPVQSFGWTRCAAGYRWVDGGLCPNSDESEPYAPDRETFTLLADTQPTEDGVLEFANAHGCLGIETIKTFDGGTMRAVEPLGGWKTAIAELSYVVERWAAARGRLTLADDTAAFGWLDLRDALNQHLRHHVTLEILLTERRPRNVEPVYKTNRKPPQLRYRGLGIVVRTLLGFCWLSLAQATEAGAQFKRCHNCQRMFVTQPAGAREEQYSCSGPCRSRLAYYRKRHSEGQISIAEIAKRTGGTTPAIKEWLRRRAS